MRRYIFISCILFLTSQLRAQNWQPVAMANKYNYQQNNTNKTFATIWADSATTNTFYLNKIVKPCDTCSNIHIVNFPYDSFYVWKNVCGFLQHKIINHGNNSFEFRGEQNLLLNLNTPLNTWWLYDTANAVQAKVAGNASQLVFNVLDSVKTIVLSSSDTILVSKNHGILKFPKINSPGLYYALVGIEGLNVGYSLPKFNGFFNFNVGDIFQYTIVDDDYTSFPPLFKRGIEKRTILAKQIIGDTLRYQVKLIKADSTWLGNSIPAYAYTNTITSIDFIDSTLHFTNLYPQQLVTFNNYFTLTFLDTLISHVQCEMATNNAVIKRMGLPCPYYLPTSNYPYGVAVYSHSITNLYLATNSNLTFGREAKEHLGITSEMFYDYDFLKSTCLSAYRANNDSLGTILPDGQILSINEQTMDYQFIVYPNPSKNGFTVYNNTAGELGNLYLYNNLGELVLQAKEDLKTTVIKTEKLETGIYILVLETKNNKAFKKIVISR